MAGTVILLVFLVFCTGTDLCFRRILFEPIPVMIAVGCFFRWHANVPAWQELLVSFLPGFFLLLPSALGKRWIGAGDGLVFLVYGAFEGLANTLEVLFLSSVFAAVWAIVLLFIKKQEEAEFPFIPFVLAAELALRIAR